MDGAFTVAVVGVVAQELLGAVEAVGAAAAVPAADAFEGAFQLLVPVGGLFESGLRVEVSTDPGGAQGTEFLGEGSVGVPAGRDAFVELVAVA